MDPTRWKPRKKRYAAPALKNLDVGEAKILLLDEAADGDQGAKELLKLLGQTFA